MNILATNIRARIEALGITQRELAEKVGLSQVMIHKLLSGGAKKTAKIVDIAKALHCDPEWLLYGEGDEPDVKGEISESNVSTGPDIQGMVPLISWVQAGEWTDIFDNFQPGDAEEWRETTAKVSNNAFALRVVGNSMVNPAGFPSIPEGSVVIVDPDVHTDNGSIVVARLEDSMEATLKKLVIDGPNRYLMPLNPDYRPIQINGNCTIVGVVKKVEFDL